MARKLLILVYYGLRDDEVRCLAVPQAGERRTRFDASSTNAVARLYIARPGNLIEPVGSWPNPIMSAIDE